MSGKVTESDQKRGKALAASRKAKGLTQQAVAELCNRNQAWVSRIESGVLHLSPNQLDMLLDIYQPDDTLRRTIEKLSTPPPAGARHGSRVDRKFMEFTTLEQQEATEIYALTSERIPKILQCDQYLFLQYRRADRAVNEADLLAERRRRQQVLARENPPRFNIILAESALYRMPGGNLNLVKEQAAYLIKLIDRFPKLRLQVLSFDANVPYLDADMVFLRTAKVRPQGFVPFGASVSRLDGRERTESLRYWRSVRQAALDVRQSREFLNRLAEVGYRQQITDQSLVNVASEALTKGGLR